MASTPAMRSDLAGALVIRTHDQPLRARAELRERQPELLLSARVEVHVIHLDVRDDADRRVRQQERAVALVGFEEEEVAAPGSGAAPALVQIAADQEGGIEAGRVPAPRRSSRSSSSSRWCPPPRSTGGRRRTRRSPVVAPTRRARGRERRTAPGSPPRSRSRSRRRRDRRARSRRDRPGRAHREPRAHGVPRSPSGPSPRPRSPSPGRAGRGSASPLPRRRSGAPSSPPPTRGHRAWGSNRTGAGTAASCRSHPHRRPTSWGHHIRTSSATRSSASGFAHAAPSFAITVRRSRSATSERIRRASPSGVRSRSR